MDLNGDILCARVCWLQGKERGEAQGESGLPDPIPRGFRAAAGS